MSRVTISFPIWKCDQWCAYRGVTDTAEPVVVSRWNKPEYLDAELQFLESHHRIKPIIEDKPFTAQQKLLPLINSIQCDQRHTDVILENCGDWQLKSGDLSKLLLVYYGYDLYRDQPLRDLTIENVIKNGNSIVILDFGLRRRTEEYIVWWNPLILKGLEVENHYQWGLGVMYLLFTEGNILPELHRLINNWLRGDQINFGQLCTSKKPAIQQLISQLLNPTNPILWEDIPNHQAFKEDMNCSIVLKQFKSKHIKIRYGSILASTKSIQSTPIKVNKLRNPFKIKASSLQNISQSKHYFAISNIQKEKREQNSSMEVRRSRENSFHNNQRRLSQPQSQESTPNTRQASPEQIKAIKKLSIRIQRKSEIPNLNNLEQLHASEERLPMTDNYIQLIRKSKLDFKEFDNKYTYVLECINLLGECTAMALEFLNALQNFWVIPIFLIFKRMYQLRRQLEKSLKSNENILNLVDWESICDSDHYIQFIKRVQLDNEIIFNEMSMLLESAKIKADRLTIQKRNLISWFLNNDTNNEISAVTIGYFEGQILKAIKDNKLKKSQNQQIRLEEMIVSCLKVLNSEFMKYDIDLVQLKYILTQDQLEKEIIKEFQPVS